MRSAHSWSENWRLVVPPDSLVVDLRSQPRRSLRAVRDLPTGRSVAIFNSGIASRRRCRNFARRAGVELTREFLALPSARRPAFLVQDSENVVAYFFGRVLPVPPGGPLLSLAVDGLSRLTVALSLWPVIGALYPGRLMLGRTR